MIKLAPIILFVYNRPWHVEQTLNALINNDLAGESVLYIYADGAKPNATNEQLEKIKQVREFIKSKQWCKEVHVVESNVNKGLANSVISGVTEIVNQYGKVIVIEDDIVTSKGFLKFMNDALNIYENEEKVAGISAYNHRINSKDNTFFLRQGSSWGWATWKRVWNVINFNIDSLVIAFDNQDLIKEFNIDNTYPFFQMLLDQKDKKIDSWAIRFSASVFLLNKLFLYPQYRMADSIGEDEGTHAPGGRRMKVEKIILLKEINIKKEEVFQKKRNKNALKKYLKSVNNQDNRIAINKIKVVILNKFIMITKNIFKLFGYSISKITQENAGFLKNVFNTNFSKNVLISYILTPFVSVISYSHTNVMECYTAAEVFQKIGFNVDVVDFMDGRNIDYNFYDVVYGFGYPFENAFYSDCAEKIKKIFYSTGACPFYSNKNTALKILDFYIEKDKIIPQSGRLLYQFWSMQSIMPDLNVCLGNQFVANTYLEINPYLNIKSLSIFFFDVYDIDLAKKNYKEAKKNFLWFGSSGLLHKGLDILIDIFSERNDVFLHICGASKTEKKFFNFYQAIIDKSDNIVEYGFVDINSDNYNKLMNLCGFVIYPSISEGGAAAVVNVMANGGLIPIISKSSGLDVEEYGYVFDDIEKDVILKKIDEALELTEEELYLKSLKTKSNVRDNYSYQNYKNILKEILFNEVQNNKHDFQVG